MDYMDIFQAYLDGSISISSAEIQMRNLAKNLQNSGKMGEHAKAILCITYFKRYTQYNTGRIKTGDFMLFMRDFILFVGRFRFPRLVTDAVLRDGAPFGVFVAADGAVDVLEKVPKAIEEHNNFIKEVYRLGEGSNDALEEASGDAYVHHFTKFHTYRSFEQKLAVHCALELPNDHTLMISLPTGGGKSLITQLLAAFHKRLTVVVVPTVSLAKDQYLQAIECISDEETKKNIFSFQSGGDNSKMIKGVEEKTARLIFTSPEAILKDEHFGKALRQAAEDGYLYNVVIDEAHIVPDWGTNFRPEFQIFSVVLREWRILSGKSIRTYLLSATLSDDVIDVLFDLFGSESGNAKFRCDALRKEPRYMICENHSYEHRERQIVEMVKLLPKPLIVYVIEPSVAKRYIKLLKEEGLSNVFTYTGDTKDKERDLLLEQWKNNEFDIMIATSAFGMGVDKSNVRTIVHACVPENLSRFYQEVGRAGRDGLPSLSVLCYYMGRDERKNDLSVAFGLVKGSILKQEKIKVRLESILKDARNMVDGDLVTADLSTVPATFSKEEAEHAGLRNMCWNINALLLLHRRGYINIESARYDAKEQTYFFNFRIINVDLLQDMEQLTQLLEKDRQQEYDMRVDGYHKMADMVRQPKSKCWGKQFVDLYPYAKPICSGCPVHPVGSELSEDHFRIRQKCCINVEPDPPGRLLRRYMGILPNMLIPVDAYDEVDVEQLAEICDKLSLAAFIYPDNTKVNSKTDCMTFTHSEFLEVANKIPLLLRNGMLILLSDNLSISNKVFDVAFSGNMEQYRKVWCCKLNTRIASHNRSINEFLNCRIRDINNI